MCSSDLLLFTINRNDKPGIGSEELTDAFASVVTASLRQSDVVTQNGKNQVMVILLETYQAYLSLVTDRIRKNWLDSEYSVYGDFTFESDQLTGIASAK